MYKDLLLPLTGTPADEPALRHAAGLAEALQAHLTVLVVDLGWMAREAPWDLAEPDLLRRLRDAGREHAERSVAMARALLKPCAFGWEVRMDEAGRQPVGERAVVHAWHADLVVLPGAAGGEAGDRLHRLFVHLLFGSGRPLLVVPPQGATPTAAERAVIAWRPGRESARAVHDALPLLRRCQSVEVLTLAAEVSERGHGEAPGADLATHLARHGLAVRVVNRQPFAESEGEALLRHVLECGASLLVAGGYSHAPLRERLLGGMTRTLFEGAPLPVLFAH